MATNAEKSALAERAFLARLAELGVMPDYEKWEGTGRPHKAICRVGHECYPYPSAIRKGIGPCRACAGQDPRMAEAAFRNRLAELGAAPVYDTWLGARKGHAVICKNGHACHPTPDAIRAGNGPCNTCAGTNSAAAERNYKVRLAELGAAPAWTAWIGAAKPHKVMCPQGHECSPIPSGVMGGKGLCRTCARLDPLVAEVAFRRRLDELGVVAEWATWRGNHAKYQATCAAGHECWPRPDHLRRGDGPCRACGKCDPVEAEAQTRRRLEASGFTPAWEQWVGAGRPHKVACPAGHEFPMYPSALARRGCTCPHCAGTTPEAIESVFRDAVVRQGATPAWGSWLGSSQGHRVICKNGHVVYPRPNGVGQGRGVCRFCKGRAWDVFYVVVNDVKRELKFGITSGDPRGRLAVHRNRGFSHVALIAATPLALKIETATKRALRAAGHRPAHGREYFGLDALEEVLQVAISYGLEAGISREDWPGRPGTALALRPSLAC